jgi:hypothetical protein
MYYAKSCFVKNLGGGGSGPLAAASTSSIALVFLSSLLLRLLSNYRCHGLSNRVTSSETHNYIILMLSELNFMHRVSQIINFK